MRNVGVNYSELNVDDDGNDTSSGGRKRKQSTKKETKKKGSKSKKRMSSTSTIFNSFFGEESNFTVELSDEESSFNGTDNDTLDSDDDDEYGSSSNTTGKIKSIPWNEIPLEAEGLVSRVNQVDHERMVRYRKDAEKVKAWLDTVDNLELPANPLDRLLNERKSVFFMFDSCWCEVFVYL